MYSLEHTWLEEEGEGDVRDRRLGDNAQSHVEAVKWVTGSPNYVPRPTKQGICRGLTKQSLCEKGGVGKRGCKESKRKLTSQI